MLAFRHLPIRQKLTRVNALTMAIALLLASVGFVVYEVAAFRQLMIDTLTTHAEMIGYNCKSALEFRDRQSAASTLAALRAEERVTSAGLYGPDGILFASYERDGASAVPGVIDPNRTGYVFDAGELVVAEQIFSEVKRIGSVRLTRDLSDLYERLWSYLMIAALVFGVAMLLAFPILSRLQSTISGPIVHLAETARRVSEEKDYTVRARAAGADELGALVHTFNDMLEQIRRRDSELELARDQAEVASRAKDEFLAVVSHELRTPLTPILIWAKMLHSRLEDPTLLRGVETIERSVKAQARLIEDLLDVSRIITGKLRLDTRPVDLVGVIQEAIESVRPAAEAKGVRMQSELSSDCGTVSGDAGRLQQVVWNLLSNAIKFTPSGGEVHIQLERTESSVRLQVRDSGAGISPELLPRVFDRFRQADSSSKRVHGGLGLGLAIVRHLVELHGGTVGVESEGEGKGSTFTVELPVAARVSTPALIEEEPVAAEPPDGHEPGLDTPLAGLRVLLVDDEPDSLMAVADVLGDAGAAVRSCRTASEALDTFRDWTPDLLISDIGMPGEDGYALIEKVRSLPPERGGRVPALALTAYTRTEDRIRVLSSGFQSHLAKPVEPRELVTVAASVGRPAA